MLQTESEHVYGKGSLDAPGQDSTCMLRDFKGIIYNKWLPCCPVSSHLPSKGEHMSSVCHPPRCRSRCAFPAIIPPSYQVMHVSMKFSLWLQAVSTRLDICARYDNAKAQEDIDS